MDIPQRNLIFPHRDALPLNYEDPLHDPWHNFIGKADLSKLHEFLYREDDDRFYVVSAASSFDLSDLSVLRDRFRLFIYRPSTSEPYQNPLMAGSFLYVPRLDETASDAERYVSGIKANHAEKSCRLIQIAFPDTSTPSDASGQSDPSKAASGLKEDLSRLDDLGQTRKSTRHLGKQHWYNIAKVVHLAASKDSKYTTFREKNGILYVSPGTLSPNSELRQREKRSVSGKDPLHLRRRMMPYSSQGPLKTLSWSVRKNHRQTGASLQTENFPSRGAPSVYSERSHKLGHTEPAGVTDAAAPPDSSTQNHALTTVSGSSNDSARLENPGQAFTLAMRPKPNPSSDREKESPQYPALDSRSDPPQLHQLLSPHISLPIRSHQSITSNSEHPKPHWVRRRTAHELHTNSSQATSNPSSDKDLDATSPHQRPSEDPSARADEEDSSTRNLHGREIDGSKRV